MRIHGWGGESSCHSPRKARLPWQWSRTSHIVFNLSDMESVCLAKCNRLILAFHISVALFLKLFCISFILCNIHAWKVKL